MTPGVFVLSDERCSNLIGLRGDTTIKAILLIIVFFLLVAENKMSLLNCFICFALIFF